MIWLLPLALAEEPTPVEVAETTPAPAPAPLIKDPVLLEFVDATYPEEARTAGLTATVSVEMVIGADGSVTEVKILQPVGHGFDEAAAAAVRQFRFSPAETADGPVPVALEFVYEFTLPAPAVPDDPAAPTLTATPGAPSPDTASGDPAAAPSAPVNLDGQVLEMATRIPVAGAALIVTDRSGTRLAETTADAHGHFELAGVPVGKVRIVAKRPGYQESSTPVEITAGERTTVTLWQRNLSYKDNEVVVAYERDRPPEVTRRSLSIEEVRSVPGTFGDPVRVIQNLPGAARAPFSTGLLVLRGANPEDSNVYVDGVQVPLVYHLGGFRSILNPDLISSVDYLPGTYGSRYGRATGGVIDVRTTDSYPERLTTTVKADVLDAGAYATGRVGKVGFAAGFRRSYIDAILGVVLADQGFYAAPRWMDYQLKLKWLGEGKDDLSLLFFGFNDSLIVRQEAGSDAELGVAYSTQRLVGRWVHPFGDKLSLSVQPSVGVDVTSFGFGSAISFDMTDAVFDLRGELAWKPNDAWKLAVGVDSEVKRSALAFDLEEGSVSEDPLAESESQSEDTVSWNGTPDPFVEATLRPLSNRDRLTLVGALRVPILLRTDEDVEATVDPRFAARFEVFPGGTIKAGTGLFTKPVTGSDDLAFERAWSSEAGWEQKIGSGFQADVTGFYRWMDPLTTSSFGSESTGVGRSYGMEVMLRRPKIDHFFGWISYTLSKSERNDTPDDADGWYRYEYDQTHILTGIAGYQLPWDIEVSAKATYTTGNPYTGYDGGIYMMQDGSYQGIPSADTNSERMPPYWSVDFRVEKLFTFKHWQLDLYADVLSAFHGENPEYITYNYDYTEHAYISGLPTIPSVGFQAKVNW